MSETVFLIGATGQIGTSLMEYLKPDHEQGKLKVKVGVHSSRSAEKVSAQGLIPQQFDLNRWQDFDAALKGVDRVFLLRPYTLKQKWSRKLDF